MTQLVFLTKINTSTKSISLDFVSQNIEFIYPNLPNTLLLEVSSNTLVLIEESLQTEGDELFFYKEIYRKLQPWYKWKSSQLFAEG